MDTREIIQALGGPTELGRALGIRSQAISGWARNRRIPLERIPEILVIAAAKGIPLSAQQIRADYDWGSVCCG